MKAIVICILEGLPGRVATGSLDCPRRGGYTQSSLLCVWMRKHGSDPAGL